MSSLPGALTPVLNGNTLALLVTLLITPHVLRVVYNLYFHPLSAFPGPKLAAVTRLWRAYIEIRSPGGKSFPDTLWTLHEKYGDVVRIGTNELHFANPPAFHDIYATKNRWEKDTYLYDSIRPEGRASIHLPNYLDAKKRREPMMGLLSRSSVVSLQNVVQKNVDMLCDILASQPPERHTNLHHAVQCLTLAIITSFCYGESSGSLQSPEFDDPLARAIRETQRLQPVMKHFPIARWALHQIPPEIAVRRQPFLKGFYGLRKMVANQIKQALDNPDALAAASHPTIYQAFLSASGDRKQPVLTEQQLRDEAFLLVFAGTDTTSNALLVGLINVLDNREIYERLKKELRELWPDLDSAESRPKYEQFEKLPYLKAVIKEALRLSHGALSPAGRVVPQEGAQIDGKFIPGGTVVGMANEFVHLSESVYADPRCFRPERWLNEEESANLDQWLIAFHKGPRSCIGINLAYCELFLTFGNVFRRLDLSLVGARPKDMVWKDYFLPNYAGPDIKVVAKPAKA